MNDSQKNILIFSERDFSAAPRVKREIQALKDHVNLYLAGGNSHSDLPDYSCIYDFLTFTDRVRYHVLKKKRPYATPGFSKLSKLIRTQNIRIIILHESKFLPLAIRLKQKHDLKIIFNAHEYHPLEFEDTPGWLESHGKEYERLYQTYLPKVDLFINVCGAIQQKCLEVFGADSIVIPNAAFFSDIAPVFNDTEPIRIIHHGAILPNRKIEKMISIVSSMAPRFQLDIMGMPNSSAMEYYREIEQSCSLTANVRLIPPVKFNEIVPFINQYDIGLYLLEPSSFNNFNALPNKLFEFLQAKLAIYVSPSPEMSQLIKKYNLGEISQDFSESAMIELLENTTFQKLKEFKTNAVEASRVETAEKYQQLFLDHVLSLLRT